MRYIFLAFVSSCIGCTAAFTGYDTREAAETRDLLESGQESLRSSIQSTHAGTTTILQTGATMTPSTQPGDSPTITTGEGGFAYHRDSDPTAVLAAYARSVEAVSRSFEKSLSLIERLVLREQAAEEP